MTHLHDTINKVVAFISGSGLTSFLTFIESSDVTKTILLGFVGGVAGILGKDFYSWAKRKINQWRKKWNS